MNISKPDIMPVAEKTGFKADVVEKICFLLRLLDMLNEHPFLRNKLVLKGGTALNLFVLDAPRLSVDIDLNYIGETDRARMLDERPGIEKALQAIFSREGLSMKRVPHEHAGGKWRLGYQSYTGFPGNLEVDLNFMLRQPLWPVISLDSHPFGNFQAKSIQVLDIHELAAGKLSALFSRHMARDVFDVNELFSHLSIDWERLRLAFIVYGAMSRKDWRTISPTDISFDLKEFERSLTPVLREKEIEPLKKSSSEFAMKLVGECREKLTVLFPLRKTELDFLNAVLDRGEIKPELITDDSDLQIRIRQHPMLQWKALNVRKHFNLH